MTTTLQYPVYNMPIGNRLTTESYGTPVIIDRTCNIKNTDNRFMVYVDIAHKSYTQEYFAGIHDFAKSMRPDMNIYVLVGLGTNCAPQNLSSLAKCSSIHGFLFNPPPSKEIQTQLPIDFIIKG